MTNTIKLIATLLITLYLPINFVTAKNFDKFPQKIDKNCKKGQAKLYDECSDQLKLFQNALNKAQKSNKILLVSYGAEWCIWCHVFEAYIEGKKTKFDYVFGTPNQPNAKYHATLYEREKYDVSKEANTLNNFVKNNFVVVHIENYLAPNGIEVLKKTGAFRYHSGGIPFIFTVNNKGLYSGHIKSKNVEIRRDSDDWFRGYDRKKLLTHLQNIKKRALP